MDRFFQITVAERLFYIFVSMNAATVLLKNVRATGFGKAPEQLDVRLDLRQQVVSQIAAPNTLEAQEDEEVYAQENLWMTPGWVDLRATGGEPGNEQRETLESLCRAAQKGGFTHVAMLPETVPPLTDRAGVKWILEESKSKLTQLLPIAGLSQDLSGENLSEILDLHQTGARAFTNGNRCLDQTRLITKALLYLQTCNGLVVQFPQDPALTQEAQIHEGATSTRLGMVGFPAVAESLIVARDLKLLAYAGGRLHFSGISTEESVALIRQAKSEGLQVSCDVAAYQNSFLDADMEDFDTHKKVCPPFRSAAHQEAVTAGLLDGTIDALASHHLPREQEAKKLEFDLADFGMISLQTAAATSWKSWGKILGEQNFIRKWTEAPRRILGLPQPRLRQGEPLDFTLFCPTQEWVFSPQENHSLSANSPFLGKKLSGKALAVFRKRDKA